MKFFVWKKRFVALVGNLIVLDVLFISLIIFFIVQEGDFKVSALFGTIIIIINIFSFPMLRFEGSLVLFEENKIKFMFLKFVRRIMQYNEIKDYGVFRCETMFQRGEKFIYISRFELTKEQRSSETYRLYKKNKNVLVLQYYEEALNFIKSKCPDISPHII